MSHNKEIFVNVKMHYSLWEINFVELLLVLNLINNFPALLGKIALILQNRLAPDVYLSMDSQQKKLSAKIHSCL